MQEKQKRKWPKVGRQGIRGGTDRFSGLGLRLGLRLKSLYSSPSSVEIYNEDVYVLQNV